MLYLFINSVPKLKIGKYVTITMTPITAPTATIKRGLLGIYYFPFAMGFRRN